MRTLLAAAAILAVMAGCSKTETSTTKFVNNTADSIFLTVQDGNRTILEINPVSSRTIRADLSGYNYRWGKFSGSTYEGEGTVQAVTIIER